MEEERTSEEQVTEQVATPEPEPVSEATEAEQPEPSPEPTSEIPVAEVSSEAAEAETKTVLEQLAEEVKVCFAEGKCENLGAKFDKAAEELNVPVSKLIDEVFEIAKKQA